MKIRANNNRKNKRGLLDYQKRQQELSRLTDNEARKYRVEANLELWTQSLPPQFQNARPDKLHKDTIEKIKDTSIRPPYDKFIIITAKDATVATFTAYTIMYALLQKGVMSPGEIKVTSTMDAYTNIHGMFNARYWKDTFFDKKGQLLSINGTSKALTKLGSKGEDQFWRELVEHSINNDRLVIITYITDSDEREGELFIPLITSNKELNTKIIKKSLFIKLTNKEEEEIKNEQRKLFEGL